MTHWTSEAGQDRWVHGRHPSPGYFVDVGAYDGVEHSNTYALEQLGWVGILIEPNREAAIRAGAVRTNHVWMGAASDAEGTMPFDGFVVGRGGVEVAAWTLAQMLDMDDAPPVIDYLSIDVEGHELAVLDGMDFDRWKVGLITIEHNLYRDGPHLKDAIFERLTGHGFERVVEDVEAPGWGPYEDWYVGATS